MQARNNLREQLVHGFRVGIGAAVATTCAATLFLTGCGGGQDVSGSGGGLQQNLGGDIAPGYNTSLASKGNGGKSANVLDRGAYPMIETSFEIGSTPGDPFDYEKVNVQVSLKKADGGVVSVPAFFDGGKTWRMRYTPTTPGSYAVKEIKLNGETVHESRLEKRDWTVNGKPRSGFVRIDKGNHTQFVLDNGDKYFPVGHNVGWETEKLTYSETFAKMHAAGENWSRLWLDQRDGKLFDAASVDAKQKPGQIDLVLAKHWDSIVASAEKNNIFFQLVLEHSASFSSASGFNDSSNIHAAWDKNPLNNTNGGPLKAPDSFFVDPAARTLEKRKLYYLLARYGYSPNIMAIELFRDVQNTDAAFGKRWDDIAMWHREMSIFARTNDANHHLLTTSSAPGLPIDSPVWDTVDFAQASVYGPNLVASLAPFGAGASAAGVKHLDKPLLVSEFGLPDGESAGISDLHEGLWAGLLGGTSGGAEFWDWEAVDSKNMYDSIRAVTDFCTSASLAEHSGLTPAAVVVDTTQRGTLRFSPGVNGTPPKQTQESEFVIGESGIPSGIDKLSNILQGKSANAKPITFQLSCNQAGRFSVALGRVSRGGAHVKLTEDGKPIERDFAAGNSEHALTGADRTMSVDLAAGSHTISISNEGADWITVRDFAISNYAPAIAGIQRSGKDYAIAWLYNRDGLQATEAGLSAVTPATGRIKLAGLQKGKYRITWWDTQYGKTIDTSDVEVGNAKEDAVVSTPPIARDIAFYILRAGVRSGSVAKGKKSKPALQPVSLPSNGS